MKKFYCNGKVVYMHNNHNSLSAKIVLKELGIASEFDNVCQALDQDQDMLEVSKLGTEEVAFMSTCDEAEESWEDLDKYFEVAAEDPDCYLLPNGKSAPFGLTGEELAAIPENIKVYSISLSLPGNISEAPKVRRQPNQMLVEVDRDLIFATREKAVEAYNALFGDLYGEI